MTVYLGPAGWSYADWAGIVYPKPRPRGFSELAFLARYFNAVEINTTFYHPIDAALSRSWIRKIGAREFAFTAKLWQRFTHEAAEFEPSDVHAVRAGIEPLERAGLLRAVLVQFPWSFGDSAGRRDRIRRIRDAFPDLPLVVELRHASWNTPETLRFLSELRIGFCNIDQPSSPSAICGTAHVAGRVAYVRLHGRNREAWFNPRSTVAERYDYLYSPEELKPWVERIRAMQAEAPEVFVIGNNHFQGKAVANALQIKSMLEGGPVRGPEGLVEYYKELKGYAFVPVRQPDLFS